MLIYGDEKKRYGRQIIFKIKLFFFLNSEKQTRQCDLTKLKAEKRNNREINKRLEPHFPEARVQSLVNSETSFNNYFIGRFPGDLGSIPGRVIPKTFKMLLDTSLLNTQQYKVRIKSKSRERSSAFPYTSV